MKSLYDYIAPQQWIFTIVKPGFLDHTQDIITMFGDRGWEVDRMTVKTLTLSEARNLYKVHKDKKFYDDLCDYMSSGPSRAIIYKKKGTLTSGTYKEVGVLKDTIRERWGIDESKNVIHSSDSLPAAQHESSIYF